MRLRLFSRVRGTRGIESGGSGARGRGEDAPGRHRQSGRTGRDLWQDRREPQQAGPVPSAERAPAGSRSRERGEEDGFDPFRPRRPATRPAPPSELPGRPLPRREPSAGMPLPRRKPLAGPFPGRDGPGRPSPRPDGPSPRPEARTRLPGGVRPGDQDEVRMGGARARARPWFTSPVRERPAADGIRAPGSVPGTDGRTARPRPAHEGRPSPDSALGRDAKRPWYERGGSRSRIRPAELAGTPARPAVRHRAADAPEAAPWPADAPPAADGRRHCGSLEGILHRQWDVAVSPPSEIVRAIDRLAELPGRLQEMLAVGLDGIYVGAGGVPDLDDMRHLRGMPLPSGHATWDICAGAYGSRKIIVGARPSPTPDVMCHEVGHALDDLSAPGGQWQSDSEQFRAVYDQCVPNLLSEFHRQADGLGRREFFADAFAAIASRQRPALVDMLGGDTRTALNVMLYFNRLYGI